MLLDTNLIEQAVKDIAFIKKIVIDFQQKRWLNTQELAIYLGYSRDRIYKIKDEHLIENIHFYKRCGKIIFDRVAIDDWVVGKDQHDTNATQRHIVGNILSSITKDSKES